MPSHANRPLVSLLTPGSVHQPFARLARWLAGGFEELGVRFDLCYLEGPEGTSDVGSVRFVRLGHRRAGGSIFVIARYLRAARPTFALATPGHLSPFAILAGRLASVPVVPWEQGILHFDLPTAGWAARGLFYVQRMGYPGAPTVATVSKDVATHFQAHSFRRKRFFDLPNLVDPRELKQLAGERRITDGVFRFCSVGRLTKQKGYDVMLRAFGRAKTRLPSPWELTILGTGELHAQLKALAEAEGISANVRFAGYVENPYPILASADVFVHAARWEGCPVAILEAAALGLPTIATDCPGGTREILAEGAGLLVPSEDSVALADALVAAATHESLRNALSLKASRRAQAFAPVRVAERVLKLEELVRSLETPSP